jgi:ubiquinone/menaquinone biosynthesis C-methylase UbiE
MKDSTPSESAPPRVVYDRLAPFYDRVFQKFEKWFLAQLRAETLAKLPSGGCLLEIGCGTGLNFAHYAPESCGVASELSKEMIERARQKARPPRVHLTQTHAEALPFAANSFEAAFASLVFCSIASPPRAFAELRRVVKPGGTIALLEHVRPENRLAPLFDALSLITVPLFEDHFNRRTATEARRAGLEVTQIENRLRGVVQIIVCRNPPL